MTLGNIGKFSKKFFWKKSNTQKNFFLQKIYIQNFFPTQSMPISETGTPSNTFYLWKFRAPKNALSAIFPFLYFFMYFFGIFRSGLNFLFIFGTSLFIFGTLGSGTGHEIRAYIGTGAGAVFVPILSLFCSF